MLDLLRRAGRLVALEAVDALLRVLADLVLVDTEYCWRVWHSAHLPEARTSVADGWSVSTRGRARLIRKALTMRAKATTTAMKTGRNAMAEF